MGDATTAQPAMPSPMRQNTEPMKIEIALDAFEFGMMWNHTRGEIRFQFPVLTLS